MSALMPLAASLGGVPGLALVAVAVALAIPATGAMVFGLLATQVPPERRSSTLNLIYLPLYAAGIVGPAVGGVVVQAGLPAPFLVGGAVLALGVVGVLLAGKAITGGGRPEEERLSMAEPEL